MDNTIILHQTLLIDPSYKGTRFPAETGFPAAILNLKAVDLEAALLLTGRKRYFWATHVLDEVSVTVYMNVISYSLVCWVYYGQLVPSPLIPPQLLWEMKLDIGLQ